MFFLQIAALVLKFAYPVFCSARLAYTRAVADPSTQYFVVCAAVGSRIGWWFELKTQVTGPSAQFPEALNYNPQRQPLGLFDNNVAHSHSTFGLTTYSPGYFPYQPVTMR